MSKFEPRHAPPISSFKLENIPPVTDMKGVPPADTVNITTDKVEFKVEMPPKSVAKPKSKFSKAFDTVLTGMLGLALGMMIVMLPVSVARYFEDRDLRTSVDRLATIKEAEIEALESNTDAVESQRRALAGFHDSEAALVARNEAASLRFSLGLPAISPIAGPMEVHFVKDAAPFRKSAPKAKKLIAPPVVVTP